jgi:hypothetical protein
MKQGGREISKERNQSNLPKTNTSYLEPIPF